MQCKIKMQCVNCEIKHNKGLGGSDIAGIRIAAANTDMIGSDGRWRSIVVGVTGFKLPISMCSLIR